jgi:hypothetical protein
MSYLAVLRKDLDRLGKGDCRPAAGDQPEGGRLAHGRGNADGVDSHLELTPVRVTLEGLRGGPDVVQELDDLRGADFIPKPTRP